MKKRFIIGIDLHGTLLDEQWEVKDDVKENLIKGMEAIKDFCGIYICTGNDLTFIEKYVPEDIRKYFDGYVLETGCVVSDGKKEEIIIPKSQIKVIKDLEKKLRELAPKEVKYFARRIITISLFTKDEKGGLDPIKIYPIILDLVKQFGYEKKVLVTHSNVAVDIIPKGFNKFSGIKYIAGKLGTIGIADSLNDSHMMMDSNHSFLPANASLKLIDLLKKKGRSDFYQSKFKNTQGVIDSLQFINKNLR